VPTKKKAPDLRIPIGRTNGGGKRGGLSSGTFFRLERTNPEDKSLGEEMNVGRQNAPSLNIGEARVIQGEKFLTKGDQVLWRGGGEKKHRGQESFSGIVAL